MYVYRTRNSTKHLATPDFPFLGGPFSIFLFLIFPPPPAYHAAQRSLKFAASEMSCSIKKSDLTIHSLDLGCGRFCEV